MRRIFLMEYMYDNRLRGAAQPKPLSNRVERKNLAVSQKTGLKSSHKSLKNKGGRAGWNLRECTAGKDAALICARQSTRRSSSLIWMERLRTAAIPGTIRMLDELAPHATLAILTNGSRRYCEACIEAFALSPYIALHSGFVSGVTKAQRIRQWQGETGATIVIVVGDRVTDIENARAAGAYAIGVTYGMGDREELAGADCLCDTPQEVAACCMRLIDAQ